MSNYLVGKGDLRTLSLHTSYGDTIDISKLAQTISFYEDIMATGLCADVHILDGIALQSTTQLAGGEYVLVDIGERGGKFRQLKSKFVLNSLDNRSFVRKDLDAYSLNLMAPELVLDASSQVWKAYNKPISDIIKNVVEEYLTPISGKKLIETEETNGLYSTVGAGVTPMAFIKQLCRAAESTQYPSSIFLFYERVEGYFFHTLDYLYSKEPLHRLYHDLSYMSLSEGDTMNRQQNHITDIHYETGGFDIMQPGQYNNKTIAFDPLRKSMKTVTYKYDQDKSTISGKTKSYINKPTMVSYIMTDEMRTESPYVTDKQSYYRRQNFAGREKAVMAQYSAMKLRVSIPGNSNIAIGQTIDLVIPLADDTTSGKTQNDQFYAGKWLVASIGHKFNLQEDEYHTTIELIRPTYDKKIK